MVRAERTYAKNRDCYYRWMDNNKDKYQNNIKAQNAKRRDPNSWRNISKIFRQILLD
jgi:hypothetical protein